MRIPQLKFFNNDYSVDYFTDDFNGTDGTFISTYDANYQRMTASSWPKIYNPSGEEQLRMPGTYQKALMFYDHGSDGGIQTSRVYAVIGERGADSTPNVGPAVRASTSGAYCIRFGASGSSAAITTIALAKYNTNNTITWVQNIVTTGISLSSTAVHDMELSVYDNDSGNPVLSFRIDDLNYGEIYTDTSNLFLTGKPGFTINTEGNNTLQQIHDFESTIHVQLSSSINIIKYIRHFIGGM